MNSCPHLSPGFALLSKCEVTLPSACSQYFSPGLGMAWNMQFSGAKAKQPGGPSGQHLIANTQSKKKLCFPEPFPSMQSPDPRMGLPYMLFWPCPALFPGVHFPDSNEKATSSTTAVFPVMAHGRAGTDHHTDPEVLPVPTWLGFVQKHRLKCVRPGATLEVAHSSTGDFQDWILASHFLCDLV